ncbi:MAG: nucleotide exchange factor GrpE [Candidatus Liptonbacteria bacterium]|nr:nucleotide exchange factor GrpE [Candidatus Liptonbacteria bacterium]
MNEEPNNPFPDQPNEPENELTKVQEERDTYLSGWQRAKADFINYKKEEFARLGEIAKYGNEDLIRELIGVIDNFDLGLAALEKSGPIEKGIYIIRAQIEDILKKRGLEKINVKPGDPFDPNLAEAVTEVESDKPPGVIVEIIEPGYRLHGKILRPTRIKISKGQS